MIQGGLKNLVVLKNLPSNIVEEAIIVLKTNKKIKQVEKIEKEKMTENKDTKTREDDYILKEAEMLVNTYISKLEDKKKTREQLKKNSSYNYQCSRKARGMWCAALIMKDGWQIKEDYPW